MNRKLGLVGAATTGVSVFAFLVSMVVGFWKPTLFASCFSSMIIAIGYLTLVSALMGANRDGAKRGIGYLALGAGAVYTVLVLVVYFAQCTTVRMNTGLSAEALSLIGYDKLGSLFFNYDLLGYGMMGLSTFLAGFLVRPTSRGSRVLRWLLWLHGSFFPICLIMPMFPLFSGSSGQDTGTYMLMGWFVYFLTIAILSLRYFRRANAA